MNALGPSSDVGAASIDDESGATLGHDLYRNITEGIAGVMSALYVRCVVVV